MPNATTEKRNVSSRSAEISNAKTSGDAAKSDSDGRRSITILAPPTSARRRARNVFCAAFISRDSAEIGFRIDVDDHARIVAFDQIDCIGVSLQHRSRAAVPRQREQLASQRA